MTKIEPINERHWLNPDPNIGNGFISTMVNVPYINSGKYISIDASLIIADCYRQINLDFTIEGDVDVVEEEFHRVINKMELIQEVISRMKTNLTERYEKIVKDVDKSDKSE